MQRSGKVVQRISFRHACRFNGGADQHRSSAELECDGVGRYADSGGKVTVLTTMQTSGVGQENERGWRVAVGPRLARQTHIQGAVWAVG